MSNIALNSLLYLTWDEIQNSKIELNMTVGRGGETFLERWLSHTSEERERGNTDCSYWGWYGAKRNFYPGQYVFSFVKMSCDEWLFVSAAKIISIPENSRAEVEILTQYQALFGRLIIKYHKGNTNARYVFKLSNVIDKIIVKEILPCVYAGEDFEGYDRVHLSFRLLQSIFDGRIMPTYYHALQKITGIYCLTDEKNGKMYIGSASGEGGVAQRWGNYLSSSHGGNKKLIQLYQTEGEEYFKKYFSFTLLEYYGLSYDPEEIIKREQYWKNCLQTIKHGYNDN